VTVNCPLDCTYLVEARQHEKPPAMSAQQLPNQDIHISEEFLRDHEPLLIFVGAKLLEASLETAGAVDSDTQEALESLIRTYRTLESGLYYETRPNNLLAASIHLKIQDAVQELRKELSEKGATPIRDTEILGILVFLERVGLHERNGRPRGRAFIDYLRGYFPQKQAGPADASSLIQV
jgi:hypothetical protein